MAVKKDLALGAHLLVAALDVDGGRPRRAVGAAAARHSGSGCADREQQRQGGAWDHGCCCAVGVGVGVGVGAVGGCRLPVDRLDRSSLLAAGKLANWLAGQRESERESVSDVQVVVPFQHVFKLRSRS